ncbi:MAG TPA: SUF system NifU family Fe-S cluster assembly protein [Defluviitoga sp.]|nr:SUF system NifU family Fe-S cluster assembly protein [Defluviitoga sp.]HOP24490.1 SUF system NifU family Fe-S cluster assembly protein [Defluviitoga sp.]HQD62968.1 SUF system NifU family Fe-S cluster assembly protein [Defluviitoga sp.]
MVKIGIEDLYSDIILDYAKNNKYKKEIPASQKAEGKNLSCGDEITIFLKVDNGKIVEASYLGHGCIISQASAAMMCEIIEGKTVEEAEKILNEVIKMSQGKEYDNDLIDGLEVFSDISKFPMRIKCFTLSWHTLEDVINKQA